MRAPLSDQSSRSNSRRLSSMRLAVSCSVCTSSSSSMSSAVVSFCLRKACSRLRSSRSACFCCTHATTHASELHAWHIMQTRTYVVDVLVLLVFVHDLLKPVERIKRLEHNTSARALSTPTQSQIKAVTIPRPGPRSPEYTRRQWQNRRPKSTTRGGECSCTSGPLPAQSSPRS